MNGKLFVFGLILALILMAGCTQPTPGSDRDEHGCIPSAGYAWCEAKQKCLRAWEENCTLSFQEQASSFCRKENVAAVYTCGQSIRVVSSLLGGGSTFYDKNGQEVARCPVVAPDSMSEQCRLLLFGSNCVEEQVDCGALVGGDRDEHGCIPSAGYAWCEAKQKCLRPWEEACDSTLTYKQAADIALNSTCMGVGNLTGELQYNNATRTWWFDLDAVKPGCSPACVVLEDNLTAEINWRCTGLLPG
jgi:hypothetical protein